MATRVTPLELPYAQLNLRFNPFGELPTEQRAALAVVDLAPLRDVLQAERGAVLVLGECGHGKTTHLLAIRRTLFADAPYLHLAQGAPTPSLPEVPVLFLDEVQRLGRRLRQRLFGGPGRLILGSHADHGSALRHAGRPLATIRLGPDQLTAGRLARIIERRIEHARRAPGPVPRVPTSSLTRLIERFGSDVRAIEGALYEHFCVLQETGDVQV